MGLTRTELINRSLVLLGERRVFSATQDTPTAQALNSIYDHTRRKLIEEHEWSFCKKKQRLATSGDITDTGWSYSYAIPSDFISVIAVNDTEKGASRAPHFEIAGTLILTNESSCVIWYTYDPGDGGRYTPLFEDAFSKQLAADTSQDRTDSIGQTEELERKARLALVKAKSKDSERSNQYGPSDVDFPYIHSRRTGIYDPNDSPFII